MPVVMVTRFAPSPTGALHLGHAFSAIQAHDRARREGGTFLLRIEDIDGTRSRPEHVQGIFDDLARLGLTWDGPVIFQSARLAAYELALSQLRERGLLYPCFCTRADIAASSTAPHGPAGTVYPGTCRLLDPAIRQARLATEPHAWRIDMVRAVAAIGGVEGLVWRDELAGVVPADPLAHGDVVLGRKDAPASYHLAVTVDDAAQGVTHIVRGVDLFEATHVHRVLQALLDLPVPVYRHHALLTDAAGNRLAKRHGAPSLASLYAAGQDGSVLAAMLRRGQAPPGFALPPA
ncbi:tRNA glutamyl-Q(34) synthetase GluQRS [Sphingomonas alpina]|uniref:tRNA glutamyl-Q(34) synthetase GluQRS n=1 Tax=Sphingomonas alpina TaxID=653931 RepID=A0A7H0LGZ4_9SPHN|nr:tRNA glutamyl-Q(34) synthetase GluQRS [Sphingomonas alpina]QNQ08947.1 tRNA glutamyl-Q(34) synthetase GluQRS [Sphingomonas alpina]